MADAWCVHGPSSCVYKWGTVCHPGWTENLILLERAKSTGNNSLYAMLAVKKRYWNWLGHSTAASNLVMTSFDGTRNPVKSEDDDSRADVTENNRTAFRSIKSDGHDILRSQMGRSETGGILNNKPYTFSCVYVVIKTICWHYTKYIYCCKWTCASFNEQIFYYQFPSILDILGPPDIFNLPLSVPSGNPTFSGLYVSCTRYRENIMGRSGTLRA